MKKSKLQFGLGTLMLLIVPIAVLVFFVNRHYELGNRPVQWQDFSQAMLEKNLNDDKTVLVFLRYDAIVTAPHYNELFKKPDFRRYVHSNQVAMLTSSMTTDNGMHPLVDKHGFSTLLIFDPLAPEEPLTFPTAVSFGEKKILEALRKGSKLENKPKQFY